MKQPFLSAAILLVLGGSIALAEAPKTLSIDVPEPTPIRARIKMPARVHIDFRQVLGSSDAHVNPQSLRLLRLDTKGKTTGDPVPVRFDDPDPKPGSFFYAFVGGGGQNGDLVFQHTAGSEPVAHYRLEYEPWDLKNGTVPPSPAPLIGDFDILRYASGGPMSGIFQTKVTVTDWDGDGTPDIIAGDSLGGLTLYRRKSKGLYDFDVPVSIDLDGKPIRMNWMSAPCAADWDGDGLTDLICAEETSQIMFLKNIGTPGHPKLAAPVPLKDSTGTVIKSPFKPVKEMSFFKKDYAPTPTVFDYDGDGKPDLIFGGYVTGRMYYYHNIAQTARQAPILEDAGVLKTEDGQPIDVTWCASPEFADLDGDGLPDLISGHIAEEKDRFGWTAEPSLYFWKNVGTRSQPKWRAADFGFPKHWTKYPPDVTVARVVDWNGDGLPDIIMSGRCEVFYFENVGTRIKPRFEFRKRFEMANGPLILCPRFNAIAPCLADLDGDGLPDLISGGSGDVPWSHMIQFGNTPTFEDRGYLYAGGKKIYHEFAPGDDTTFPFVIDWDGDGLLDILMGDGDGFVTFYRNIGTKTQPKFAAGVKLKMTDGSDLCVGPPTPKVVTDFEGHSGNRSVPAPGDFDGDGKLDLVCANAAGDVLFYRNAGDGRFEPGVKFASGNNRAWVWPVDWDGDGKMDVVLNWSGGKPAIYLNRGMGADGAPKFEVLPIDKYMPWIPHPRPIAIDWDHDGDLDLVWGSSYSLLHFSARYFLTHGYVEAKLSQP